MTSHAAPRGRSGGFLASIAGKITLRMLLVAAIPALAVGAVTLGILFALAGRADDQLEANRSALAEDTIGARQAEQARLLVSSIDTFFGERLSDVVDWSRASVITETAGAISPQAAELAALPTAAVDGQVRPDQQLDLSGRSASWLAAQIEAQPAFVQGIVTDTNGFTVGAAFPATDFTSADREWWQRAWSDGAFLGAVEIDESTGVLAVPMAVRIDDLATGRALGVLKASVDVTAIQPLADAFADEEEGVEVRILTGSGLLLAETSSDHDAARIATELPFEGEHGAAYSNALTGSESTGSVILDDTVGGFGRTGAVRNVERLGIQIANHDWVVFVEQPASNALAPLSGLESLRADLTTTARVMAVVVLVVLLLALAGALLLGRLLAERIARPINELSDEANRLADVELPRMVAYLQQPGGNGRAPVVEPLLVEADGEVAELAAAFDSVRTTAVDLAAEQAIGRSRDVSELLTSLGRRNQQLVGRQLRFIDDLERTESDPDVLRNLFVLDQMATRMRRNAESLLVLAGEESSRRVGRARPIDEVVRAAVSEVEDYARVRLGVIEPASVKPSAVNNLTHLLAELIENATNFSPPDELVEVYGTADPDGYYTLAVVDHGVGMSRDRLRASNERLQGVSFTEESSSSMLGLHVVGRLAARHGIDARLVESATVGTTAKVTLPPSCLSDTDGPPGEVARSRLHGEEDGDGGHDPALSWPPPVVRPAPATRRRLHEHPAPEPIPADHSPAVAAAENPVAPPQSIEALAAAALDAADALDELEGPGDEPVQPGDVHQTEPDAATASGSAASVAEVTATAGSRPRQEDETAGLPIPPFRARESKRPVGVPDLGADEEEPSSPVGPPLASGSNAGASTGETAGADGLRAEETANLQAAVGSAPSERLQVRRRVRRHDDSGHDPLEPIAPALAVDDDPEARAASVRAKLDRFASGVRAAKNDTAITPAPAPTGELLRAEIEQARLDLAEGRHDLPDGPNGSGGSDRLADGDGNGELVSSPRPRNPETEGQAT